MFKIITTLLFLLTTSYATDVAQTTQNIRSYPFVEDKLGIKVNYDVVNSGMDIFNIRGDNNGEAKQHGTIGGLSGLNLTLGYGYNEFVSIIYDLNYKSFDYASKSAKNIKNELFVKLNIYHNPSSIIDTMSMDLGMVNNSGDDLSISNSSLGISKMSDLGDSSFYTRLLIGSKIMYSVLDFYLGLKYTSIDTTLDSKSYDRSEIAINAGLQHTVEFGNFLLESGYEYIRLANREVANVEKSNHVLNLTLSRVIDRNFILFVGGKYYAHQFNGVIPYLYNDKTKDKINQNFGYVTFGFVYNFDLNLNMDELNKPWVR